MKLEDFQYLQARVRASKEAVAPTPDPEEIAEAAPPAKKPRAKPKYEEFGLQKTVSQWLDLYLGEYTWFHVPNERKDPKERGMLASQGVKKGVPDIVIILRTKEGQSGYAIEMKQPALKDAEDSRAGASPQQSLWLDSFERQGWRTAVAYSLADVRGLVQTAYPAAWLRQVRDCTAG